MRLLKKNELTFDLKEVLNPKNDKQKIGKRQFKHQILTNGRVAFLFLLNQIE
jgi:hypothetical protein